MGKQTRILGLRTSHLSKRGRISSCSNKFAWPRLGLVEAPDWDPRPVCGGGLHFLKSGAGDSEQLYWQAGPVVFQVVEAVKREIVAIDGGAKYKAPRVWVVYTGDRNGAIDYLIAHGCNPRTVVGAYQIGGSCAKLVGASRAAIIAGRGANIRVGDFAQVTVGAAATVCAGRAAHVISGCGASITTGHAAVVTAGISSNISVGDSSCVNSGSISNVVGGDNVSLVAGADSTLQAGCNSTLVGGSRSILSAGAHSSLIWENALLYDKHGNYKTYTHLCRVGSGGITAGVRYKLEGRKVIRACEADV